MEDRFFYKEEIFFADKSDRELGQNQEKIIDSLRGNLAVGVVGGFFEEGYPVYFISQFALHNLGMSFEAFMERTGGRYLDAVYEEDRRIFDAESMQERLVREYRMTNGNGEPVWVNEVRTLSTARDGRKIWVCSLRLIDEDYRKQWLHQEAFSLMKDAYYRISFVNLKQNHIETLKLEGVEEQAESLLRGDYCKVLEHCAGGYVDEEFREISEYPVAGKSADSAQYLRRTHLFHL